MKSRKIEGIFNYCDRWCERCTFTSRCAVYEAETQSSSEEHDIQNKAFWEQLGQTFIQAQDLLKKAAAQNGVDLNTASADEAYHRRRAQIKKESHQHPLVQLSLAYGEAGRTWIKTQPGMLDRLENLKTELNLGVETTEGAKHETHTIKDSLAVIQWYLAFIHVKLTSAVMGKLSSASEDGGVYQREYAGTAKIACIAIERSMQAWLALFEILPENEDHFLEILSMLERLKTMTLETFPGAQTFIRPGFDDDNP